MHRLFQFTICVVVIFAYKVVPAETIWVDSDSESGICGCSVAHSCCGLRNAIGVAGSGDTITFRQSMSGSTITLTGGELYITKNLKIDGDLDNNTTPDITIRTDSEDRIFRIANALLVSLDGLIISDGGPSPGFYGAGVAIGTGGITTIKNSTIRNNGDWRGAWNLQGGGIHNLGSLYLDNCRVYGNKAQSGGGIYNSHFLSVINSSIDSNNGKTQGGGIYTSATASVNVSGSEIKYNKLDRLIGDPADPVGAGVYNLGNFVMNTSVIKGNSITNYSVPGPFFPKYGAAGGLYNLGIATISRSAFIGNSAERGGGVMNVEEMTLENCTFYYNRSDFGGAIFNSTLASGPGTDEKLIVRNCTIYKNTAVANQGGGIYFYWASGPGGERISNTIIAGNDYVTGGNDCQIVPGRGSLEVNGYNLIEDNSCSPTYSGDPRLGELAQNGGPTETVALLAGSRAIDAGGNLYVTGTMTTDQRGSGYPRIKYGRVDIGAFEYHRTTLFPIRSKDGKTIIITY